MAVAKAVHQEMDMAWASPKTLMHVYQHANKADWRRHLKWFAEAGYPDIKKLEALLDRKGNPDTASQELRQEPDRGDIGSEGFRGGRLDGSRDGNR